MAMMSSRNLACTPVLSAEIVLATTPSCAFKRMLWVQKKCSDITMRLIAGLNHVCHMCNSQAWPISGRTVTEVDVDGTMLDVEVTFCYLGSMLCSGGGFDNVIAAICCVA